MPKATEVTEAVEALAQLNYAKRCLAADRPENWDEETEAYRGLYRGGAREALAVVQPSIEDSCRKRFEEELLGRGVITAFEAAASAVRSFDRSRANPDSCGGTTLRHDLRAALQATREGGS